MSRIKTVNKHVFTYMLSRTVMQIPDELRLDRHFLVLVDLDVRDSHQLSLGIQVNWRQKC